MEKKQLTANIMFFIVAFIIFISSAFAWFNLSSKSDLKGINTNVDDLKNAINLEVKRNNGEFQIIDTQTALTNLFKYTVPGDFYTFRIVINNKTDKERSLFGTIQNIESEGDSDYDLTNVFYLDKVNIKITDDKNQEVSNTSSYLTPKSDLEVTVYEQTLSLYRLNNLMNDSDNLVVFYNLVLQAKEKAEITFSIVYDIKTTNINYQYNELTFDSIFVLGA